ncbi:MAG: dTMP kinase [Actinomycetes bacterium]
MPDAGCRWLTLSEGAVRVTLVSTGQQGQLALPVGRRSDVVLPGFFLALEGGEGAGKSTQAQLLAQWLTAEGHDVLVTREPGGTRLGEQLREAVLRLDGPDPTPRAEALLYAADRAEHVATTVLPALEQGRVVITDRYLASSVAYQGQGRELGADEVEALSLWAVQGLRPDLTVLLDIDPEEGLSRAPDPTDRLEAEPLQFHRTVRQAFLRMAAADAAGWRVVDAVGPVEGVQSRLRQVVGRALAERSSARYLAGRPAAPDGYQS